MNNIILMRNQEAVAYYMNETGYGFRYGVLVKTSYHDGARYGFVTTSGQVTKEYKTKKGMIKWINDREWNEIKMDYHKNKCLEIIRKLGE